MANFFSNFFESFVTQIQLHPNAKIITTYPEKKHGTTFDGSLTFVIQALIQLIRCSQYNFKIDLKLITNSYKLTSFNQQWGLHSSFLINY